MSQHAIEGLIEDTVYLIDKAGLPGIDKRAYFRKLYRIQAFYDTGYTHFRVMDILLKHGFVHRIPLESHPDYERRKSHFDGLEVPGWLRNDDVDGSVYLQQEDGQRYLYFDVGDAFWEQVCAMGLLAEGDCRPLEDIGIPKVIRIALEEAGRQGGKRLLNDWYGLLVKGYIERVFDEKEGFPATLGGLSADEECLAIRQIAQRNGVKRLRDADEDVQLPNLREELDMAKGLEEKFTIRFFLELRKTPEALLEAYGKARKALTKAAERAAREKAEGANVFDELIGGRLGNALAEKGWQKGNPSRENTWLWYRDAGSDRQFVWVQFDPEEKFLLCQQGMQHGLLLKWQRREPDEEIHHLHFYRNIQVAFLGDWMNGNKHIHHFGGWKFDPTKSRKTLEPRIDNLIEALEIVGDGYFDYLGEQFPDRFFERDPERLLYLLEEGEDETGIIPDYVLFDSPYSILFAFAFHYALQGNEERAAWCLASVRDTYANRPRKSAYITQYVEPFLEQWPAKGTDTVLPPLYHYYLHGYLITQYGL